MAAITSNGTGGGNWSAGASWTGASVPGVGDNATIQNGDTITIDQNVTTGADTSTAAIDVASGGKLEVLNTVAADYTLTCKGDLKISSGGTIEFGTVANPIPIARKFTIKLNYSGALSAGKYGFLNYGTMTIQGASKTSHTLLTSDLSATGTVWTVGDTTGWEAGDIVAIASTTRTYSQHEQEVIQTVDSGTQITCVAGVTHAHSGTSPTQAEVINLTRNIKVTAYNAAYNGYVYIAAGSTTNCNNTEFSELGLNSTNKHGLEIRATGANNCNIGYCSIYNCYELYLYYSTYTAIDYCSLYNNQRIYMFQSNYCYLTHSIGIYFKASPYTNRCYYLTVENSTFVSVNGYGFHFYLSSFTSLADIFTHSNGGYGLYLQNIYARVDLANLSLWRNNSGGLYLENSFCNINTGSLFGNDYSNIYIVKCPSCTFTDIELDGDGYTDYGLEIDDNYGVITLVDSSLGDTGVHQSADIVCYSNTYFNCILKNTKLATTPEIEDIHLTTIGSYIQSEDHDKVQYADKAWYRNGIVVRDGTTKKYGSYATRFDYQYNNAEWLEYETYIPVKDGEQIAASAWLRKNASYTNANRPKITISGQGIAEDSTQMSDVTDTWERVTVTGTPTRTGLAKLTISTYLVNAGASAWVDFQKTDILSGVLNTIEGDFWANGHIAEVFMDTGSITAKEFWSTLTADVNATASFGTLLKDYIDAAISGRAPANEYDTQMAYIPSDLSDVPTDSELDTAHGAGSWEGTTPADVADAVWDELEAGHTDAGSFGEEVTKQGKKLDRNLVWLLP